MEAKNAIMSDEQLGKAVRGEWNASHLRVAEAQADITWEASKRATQEHILKYLKHLSKNYPKISLAYTIGLIEAADPDWRETE